MEPGFKKVKVKLVGEDGNSFAIMGRVVRALRRAGHGREVIKAYQNEAMSGDYDHLLTTTLEYAEDSCGDEEDD